MKSTLPLILFASLTTALPVSAQGVLLDPTRINEPPVLPRGLVSWSPTPDDTRPQRGPRLFRMPSRFVDSTLLQDDDDEPDDGRVQLAMGADNPYFDFRRPGDAGGVGYHKISTQMLLSDDGAACWKLNFQAVTPAGLESDGLAQGRSMIFPALTYTRDLGEGTGLTGFVGKSARAQLQQALEHLDQNVRYGVAVHRPLPLTGLDPGEQMYFFVEAIGNRRNGGEGHAPAGAWELVPGIHWQTNERCWLSGGVMVPFGAPRPETGIWQLTCSWQF
ncbi:MAG: hypothetical protein K2R98_07155 [Gemmataceae bacterium]|nr:hypothetical protein [Gemmataceae bacterium]